MYHNFVPADLHNQADEFINTLKDLNNNLKQCPYCLHHDLYNINIAAGYFRCKSCKRNFNRSLNTRFYRLAPLKLLPVIAEYRLCGLNHVIIGKRLTDYSVWMIKRRVTAIEQYMQMHYAELYVWYQGIIENAEMAIPNIITEQSNLLKVWLNQVLLNTAATCPHCQSKDCQKIGLQRAQFRCKKCWRYFSNLKGTGLDHLGHSESWIQMIDMLVAWKSNREIEIALNMSSGTVTKAKRRWLDIIQKKNLLALKEWISKQ